VCNPTDFPPYDPPITETQRAALVVLRLVDEYETRIHRRERSAMSTHDRPAGIPARYDIMRGGYYGTTDDRADRWYTYDAADIIIDKRGPGHATRAEAWTHLLDLAGRCPACSQPIGTRTTCSRCPWSTDADPLAGRRRW